MNTETTTTVDTSAHAVLTLAGMLGHECSYLPKAFDAIVTLADLRQAWAMSNLLSRRYDQRNPVKYPPIGGIPAWDDVPAEELDPEPVQHEWPDLLIEPDGPMSAADMAAYEAAIAAYNEARRAADAAYNEAMHQRALAPVPNGAADGMYWITPSGRVTMYVTEQRMVYDTADYLGSYRIYLAVSSGETGDDGGHTVLALRSHDTYNTRQPAGWEVVEWRPELLVQREDGVNPWGETIPAGTDRSDRLSYIVEADRALGGTIMSDLRRQAEWRSENPDWPLNDESAASVATSNAVYAALLPLAEAYAARFTPVAS